MGDDDWHGTAYQAAKERELRRIAWTLASVAVFSFASTCLLGANYLLDLGWFSP